ncbi:class I SAM-dependent methyltransferase [Streptomyces thermolilacinus]|uniref:class I SAM-dependent methyltransferase n=1 Tax=Streptomyces thermolilacinus TaxID=285540 RepID=UPI00340E7ADD
MPEESPRDWTRLIGSLAPRPAPAVVEAGAGTGMFCASMARRLDGASVVGVDASAAMLAQARRGHAHPAVRCLPGATEALPTRPACSAWRCCPA